MEDHVGEAVTSKHDLIFVTSSMCSQGVESAVRARLAVDAAREAQRLGIPMLAVDASTTGSDLPAALRALGVTVHKQTFKGRKGAALREGIAVAVGMLSEGGVIVYSEAEKVGLVRFIPDIAAACRMEKHGELGGAGNERTAIVVPRRNREQFEATYPAEQVASETFANLHLDNLARAHCPEAFAKVAAGKGSLDWTVGPFALRKEHAGLWLECEGDLWDAQLVPIIHAVRKGLRVDELILPYEHPEEMKREEEGSAEWGAKRLFQLQFLHDTLSKGWVDELA